MSDRFRNVKSHTRDEENARVLIGRLRMSKQDKQVKTPQKHPKGREKKEAISKNGANSEKQKRKFEYAGFSTERDGLMVLSLGDSTLQTQILDLAPSRCFSLLVTRALPY